MSDAGQIAEAIPPTWNKGGLNETLKLADNARCWRATIADPSNDAIIGEDLSGFAITPNGLQGIAGRAWSTISPNPLAGLRSLQPAGPRGMCRLDERFGGPQWAAASGTSSSAALCEGLGLTVMATQRAIGCRRSILLQYQ
jgi:hypothetical protein